MTKTLNSLIVLAVTLVIAAVVIQAAIGALVTLAIVGTACFVTVQLVLFYINRW